MFFQQNMSGKLLRFSTELPFVFYVQGRMAGVNANDPQLEWMFGHIQCFSFMPRLPRFSALKQWYFRTHLPQIQDIFSVPKSPAEIHTLGDELLPLERWLVWCPLNSLCIYQECALAPGHFWEKLPPWCPGIDDDSMLWDCNAYFWVKALVILVGISRKFSDFLRFGSSFSSLCVGLYVFTRCWKCMSL